MSLGKEKLEEYRKVLSTRREALVAELHKSTQQLIDDEVNYTDAIDQASADSDKTVLMQMKNRDRDILLQLNEALRRIDTGIYGQCERCDELISEARIKAFPVATLCIDCKAEMESQGIKEIRYSGRA
jgi:DnaK suppressor protein